ncbi:MAG: NAD(P)(+) transhydrogenase (Re/Si-specific) subunit beta [Planctomycetota bacterium]|nr:NAD(P)(+) transhydrogenase (Re/Si-specific) subunit beta [Planctomycetota bacterium]
MNAAITICYLLAGIGFIVGLRMLGKTQSARKGNWVSALGMLAAVLGAFLAIVRDSGAEFSFGNVVWIVVGVVLGGVIGAVTARMVKMTAMPEMVALFNGFGGIASLLVAAATVVWLGGNAGGHFSAATLFLAMLIGGITFTGSLVAFGKLAEKLPSKPILYSGQNVVNALVMLLVVVAGVCYTIWPDQWWIFLVVSLISLYFGVAVVIPIGGADMPVVISLLNSYSGLAACAAGFAVNNTLLIITGGLVGASGIILTRIMCKAMNRSLANVLFSGFGSGSGGSGAAAAGGSQGTAKSMTPEDAYYILEAAQSVVIVPGYGMAVAQAQHAVRELAEQLEANGCEVKFAIHPVAGRMPGHMNVLLAEANVPYEQLVEMDDINPVMATMDVAIVLGANDVVNPAAREEESSPIYGMPVINVDEARTVFVLKRSMRSGFAGIENPLFFKDNTSMIFGDAKATIEAMVAEFKE